MNEDKVALKNRRILPDLIGFLHFDGLKFAGIGIDMVNKTLKTKLEHSNNDFKLKPISACVRAVITGGVFMGAVSPVPVRAELPVPAAQWTANNVTSEIVGNTMNINQYDPAVTLNWNTFNVGAQNTVNFKQPDANSIAVNNILATDAAPSQILGQLNANGRIYLINQNGFVFGKDSVVDTHGLVASTLKVSEQAIADGISKVAEKDGIAAFEGNGEFYLKNADGSFQLDSAGKKIPVAIDVQEGARIKAADGHAILIMAPTIVNKGNIESNGGQVIMAAATDKVYLQEAPTDSAVANSDVRGLLVEVKTGGKVENLGTISANRGNVTLMGFAVNQQGKVSATTSINENGTIRLLAREGGNTIRNARGAYDIASESTNRTVDSGDGLGTSARVTLGGQSTTEILPEIQYTNGIETRAVNGQAQPESRVEIMANNVRMNGGAKLIVPSGKIEVTATKSPISPMIDDGTFKNSTSDIQIDAGVKIDVAGLDATKSMESNVISVKLQSNQLKDSPLQKGGILFGKTVQIDIRKGTTIADIQSEIGAVTYTLAERLGAGGQISLNAEGSVAVREGSVLNFSGGNVTYLGGQINTTRLMSQGVVYDIGDADPLMTYDGIYGEYSKTDPKWGETTTWTLDGPFSVSRYEQGYVEGRNAGSLQINSSNVLLKGDLFGQTTIGRTQRDLSQQPAGGRLDVGMQLSPDVIRDIAFANNNLSAALAIQPDMLLKSGIQKASFKTYGKISVAENTTLNLLQAGSLSLEGGEIDINGSIKGAGAEVSLKTVLSSGTQGVLDGHVTVAKDSSVALNGLWINDYANPGNIDSGLPLSINGGKFKVAAEGDVNMRTGSVVDVSGGAWLQGNRKIQAGKAGEISLAAAKRNSTGTPPGSNLTLDGTLTGYGLERGGVLSVEANQVEIVGSSRPDSQATGLRALQLDDDFFSRGGFAEFVVTSNTNGLTVKQDAVINLVQQNRMLNTGYLNLDNANGLAAVSTAATLLAEQRQASSLTLNANHSLVSNATSHLVVESGSRIIADDLSKVKLVSDSSLAFDGAITAHGGEIALELTTPQDPSDPLYRADQSIWVGRRAELDVSGSSRIILDRLGHRVGDVFDGGKISLIANRGFIATQGGSRIDLSGTQAMLDMPETSAAGITYAATRVGSHGGTLDIRAAEGLYLDGEILARAGDAQGTAGGTLSLAIDKTKRNEPFGSEGVFPVVPRVLMVSQRMDSPILRDSAKAGDLAPAGSNGKGFVAADNLAGSGFSTINLHADNEIRFKGAVALSVDNALKLDAPKLGWESAGSGNADTHVDLQATTVAMGSFLFAQDSLDPRAGAGVLNVNADLIDLKGSSVTDGFEVVNLLANQDIRLIGDDLKAGLAINEQAKGSFKTYTELNLSADRVFPATLSRFTLAASDGVNGKITFSSHGDKPAPILSAYGQLTVKAANIEQNGNIMAPFGEIVLQADNNINFGDLSYTSVSAQGQLIPFGITASAGLDWLYPTVNDQRLIIGAPQKLITVTADKVLKGAGAVIDLSGGGDIMAYEFLPGLGGSKDVLDTNKAFAVLPGFSGYAPLEPLETPKSGLKVGDTVNIVGGSGLAAGEYTLLPAHYALLPGAYLVTPQSGSSSVVKGWSSSRIDGAPIVSGYRSIAGTDITDQRLSTFIVEPGSVALTRSELKRSYGNEFFANFAKKNELEIPRLPQDAGQLVVDVKSYLDLPTLQADGVLGAQLDISSNNISVVNSKSGAAGVVELLAGDIDKFNVQSLFLGGTRSIDGETGNTQLDVKASSVTVAESVNLRASDLILAARDKLELKNGARLETKGRLADSGRKTLMTSGDSALLRVAAGEQSILQRTGADGLSGDLFINQGVVLAAPGGSVLLDATNDATLAGEFELAGGSLNIGAESINLGEVAGVVNNGLSLSNALIAKIAQADLMLSSRGAINLYGDVNVDIGNLTLNSAGLAGFNNSGKQAKFNAKTLTLANYTGVNAGDGTGHGTLQVNADNLILDKGNYSIGGYDNVRFAVNQAVLGKDDANLKILADTSLTAGVLSGNSLVKTSIDASGHFLQLESSAPVAGSYAGVGAQLQLTANRVDMNANLVYRSGIVNINALSNDLTLGANAMIDVSGSRVNAGLSAPALIGAGQINLGATQGNVVAEAGSRLFLKADVAEMAAGALNIKVPRGIAELKGTIDASGVTTGGHLLLDSKNFDASGFNGLNNIAATAGFSGTFDLRLRQGDIDIDDTQTVKAQTINIAADTGKLTIAGVLDARSQNGGNIGLSAEDALTLAATGRLLASAQAPGGDGGKVRMASLDQNADGAGITITNGAQIDVSNAGGKAGEVWLRADRLDSNGDGTLDVNVNTIPAASIIGTSTPLVEAVKVYNKTTIAAADITNYKTETNNYMNALISKNVVHNQFADSFKVVPGIEIRSSGNLTLNAVWDLVTWRYGVDKSPGVLTLRAAGNVLVNNDLTDGFAAGSIKLSDIGAPNVSVPDMLQTGLSWGYNIAAGADLAAADQRTVLAGTGDVSLLAAKKIRTGTGDIDIQAGRDIKYGNDKSVIYTAGRAVAEATDAASRWGFKRALVGTRFYAEYPVDGGDITLAAGRDIAGAPTTQLVTDWLLRTGNWSTNATHSGERPTAWGISLSNWGSGANKTADYRESVGALGGGNVRIKAGGNINDLSVVIPTTGKQVGEYSVAIDPANLKKTESDFNYKTNVVQINGGGNLDMSAGGNIAGGVFYVDKGTANIWAGGSLTAGNNVGAGASSGLNPVLALGDAQMHVTAGKNIMLASVVDPMLLPQGKKPDATSLFFRYSGNSSVALTSLSGDVTLENDGASIEKATNLKFSPNTKASDAKAFNIYPATLKINALEGNMTILNSLYMYPGANGGLEIFANNNIASGPGENAIQVVLSDTDPAYLPSIFVPKTNFLDADVRLTSLTSFALTPVHLHDSKPVLISTSEGNIESKNTLSFNLAKQALVKSGNDILGVSFQLQHNTADAHSIISANRDIRYKIERNPLSGTLRTVEQKISVSGPGLMTLVSGRNIDLGSSDGITSIGNTVNPNLPETGANLTVIGGLAGGGIDVAGFAKSFLTEAAVKQGYTGQLTKFMREYSGNKGLTDQQAAALFDTLAPEQRYLFDLQLLPYVQNVYFGLLKEIAQERAAATLTTDKDRLELQMVATIEKLFPGTTLLAGNQDYSYDPIAGLTVNPNTSAGEIIRNMDITLLKSIQERFGNVISLDRNATVSSPDNTIDVATALETIQRSSDSGFGKETVRKIFTARQDIKDAIRPSKGDISLFFSRIHTTDGGNIDLMTPNGGINAGLAVTGEKDDSKVGIVVQGQGGSDAMVRDNFAVNLTRYMTLNGGNIIAGSSEGNLDAGRGAAQVGALAPPKVSYDKFGQPVIVYPPAIGVSGIRSTSPSGVKPGDVALFAPRGIIDAGEAGIAAQNLVIDGTLANSSNVTVGGTSTGVPVAPTNSVSASLAGASSVAASATKSVESVSDVAKETAESRVKATSALGILNVEILGFGD